MGLKFSPIWMGLGTFFFDESPLDGTKVFFPSGWDWLLFFLTSRIQIGPKFGPIWLEVFS